jgi:hypothetical protein
MGGDCDGVGAVGERIRNKNHFNIIQSIDLLMCGWCVGCVGIEDMSPIGDGEIQIIDEGD